jgi:hypothetical protein
MDSPETTKEWDTTRIEHGSQEKNTYEKVRASVQTDYAGAHAKVDPAEIKLVRKLDTWITPTLCLMYFLNYLVILSPPSICRKITYRPSRIETRSRWRRWTG